MSPESERASRVNIARMRWRAELHRLNGDEPGAQLQEDVASLEERYLEAKLARNGNPDDSYIAFQFTSVEAELRRVRQFWRGVRDDMHSVQNATALDNFSEPSDDELLDGAA